MTVVPLFRMSLELTAFPFKSSTCVPDTWKLKSPGCALPLKLLCTTFVNCNVGLCLLVKVQKTSCWKVVSILKVTEPGVGAFTGRVWLTVKTETGGLPTLVQAMLVSPHLKLPGPASVSVIVNAPLTAIRLQVVLLPFAASANAVSHVAPCGWVNVNGNTLFASVGFPTLITLSRLEKALANSFMDRSWLPNVELLLSVLS